jgi:hypothetical protein
VINFYEPQALLPLYTLTVGAGVSFMTAVAEDHTLYMVTPDTRGVVVARLSDRRLLSRIDVGDAPARVAVMGER